MTEALNPFECPLQMHACIEASAGTGKTWSISVLVVRHIVEASRPIDSILLVTFTRAAVAELRERIRARLEDVARAAHNEAITQSDPAFLMPLLAHFDQLGIRREVVAKRCELALAQFEKASVFTIHGFCQRVLQQFAISTRLPVELNVSAGSEQATQQLAHDAVAQWYLEEARGALEKQPSRDEQRLNDAAWLNKQAASVFSVLKARPTQSLAAIFADGVPIEPPVSSETQTSDGLLPLQQLRALWDAHKSDWSTLVQKGRQQMRVNRKMEPPWEEQTAERMDAWCQLFDITPDDETVQAFKTVSRELQIVFKELLSNADKPVKFREALLTQWLKHPLISAAHAFAALPASSLRLPHAPPLSSPPMHALRELAREAPKLLEDMRVRQRSITFDDFLVLTSNAVASDSTQAKYLREQLRQRYPVAIVDEFQDTDPLQFKVFDAIYCDPAAIDSDASFVVVGDPKQAIYRFRNADLATYLDARDKLPQRFSLRYNQRSVPPLIEAVNAIFSAKPNAFATGADTRLVFERTLRGSKPLTEFVQSGVPLKACFELWELPHASELRGQKASKYWVSERVAADIARMLTAMSASMLRTGGNERPIEPRDIAVLVSTHREGRMVKEALAAVGAGAVEVGRDSIFDCPQVNDVLQLLHCLTTDASKQSLRTLRGLAATALLGWSHADIAAANAMKGRGGKTWPALTVMIDRYRWLTHQFGFARMWREWLRESGVIARLSTHDLRALSNYLQLGELLSAARTTEGAVDRDVMKLVQWLVQRVQAPHLRSVDADVDFDGDEQKMRLASDENLVRIVTIHKSKGLEYPVVYCPFLYVPPWRRTPEISSISGDDDQPLIYVGEQPQHVKAQIEEEEDAEWVRLAYVALTRATSRCVLPVGLYKLASGSSGAASGAIGSPLNRLIDSVGLTRGTSVDRERAVVEQWRTLAARLAGAIKIVPTSELDHRLHLVVESLPAGSKNEGMPRQLAAALPDASWRATSFSALQRWLLSVKEAASEQAADSVTLLEHDRDQTIRNLNPVEAVETTPVDSEVTALDLPHGVGISSEVGHFVHAIFEYVDFTDRSEWPKVILDADERFGPFLSDDSGGALVTAETMITMLDHVLGVRITPLGARLNQAPRQDSLRELGFTMAIRQGSLTTAIDWLQAQKIIEPVGDDRASERALAGLDRYLRGYLRGFMDLVVRVNGRYVVVDWKSNYLGNRPEDYAPGKLDDVMRHEGYHLQRLIYLVALHRWLSHALQDYDPRQHLAGSVYLFVRGIRPNWQVNGEPCGVFEEATNIDQVLAFDALLDDAHGVAKDAAQ